MQQPDQIHLSYEMDSGQGHLPATFKVLVVLALAVPADGMMSHFLWLDSRTLSDDVYAKSIYVFGAGCLLAFLTLIVCAVFLLVGPRSLGLVWTSVGFVAVTSIIVASLWMGWGVG